MHDRIHVEKKSSNVVRFKRIVFLIMLKVLRLLQTNIIVFNNHDLFCIICHRLLKMSDPRVQTFYNEKDLLMDAIKRVNTLK